VFFVGTLDPDLTAVEVNIAPAQRDDLAARIPVASAITEPGKAAGRAVRRAPFDLPGARIWISAPLTLGGSAADTGLRVMIVHLTPGRGCDVTAGDVADGARREPGAVGFCSL